MRTEMPDQVGRTKKLLDADGHRIPNQTLASGSAMRGLKIAVPISLVFWIAVGMVVWALKR